MGIGIKKYMKMFSHKSALWPDGDTSPFGKRKLFKPDEWVRFEL